MNDETVNTQPHESLVLFNRRVGLFIRQCRVKLDMTGHELGQKMHLSQQQISRYERGVCSVSLYQLNLFMKVLGVSWHEFMHEVVEAPLLLQEQKDKVRMRAQDSDAMSWR
ncbi:helix-turn-helix domain-containing protein [Providencia rettgeri]|uniref:Helix-turn-helix transcriptional regulator n=1 Tax=Providencia rettgeri TaxID=587 RepID=A0AAE2ZCS1_PRORE|nr:helix-turn-helix transcriptional regulator [Providencia rettgeri]MBW3117522.1 helix-turn-helix transcriptional regulator [Providencia rettgeri]NHN51117.1 helix-turn-helix transcriptional regulator [Providencia rettgeri]